MIILGFSKTYGFDGPDILLKYQTKLFQFFLMFLVLSVLLALSALSYDIFADDKVDTYEFDKTGVCQRVVSKEISSAQNESVDLTFCQKELGVTYKWVAKESGTGSDCYMVEAKDPKKKISDGKVANDFCRREGLSLKQPQISSYILKEKECYEVIGAETIGKTSANLCRAVGKKGRLFALLPNGQCGEFTVPQKATPKNQLPIVKPKTGLLAFFQGLFSSKVEIPPLIQDTLQDPNKLSEQDLLEIVDKADYFVQTVSLSNCLNLSDDNAFTYLWRADGSCGQFTKGGKVGNPYLPPLVQVYAPVDDKYCLADKGNGDSQKINYKWDIRTGTARCAEYIESIAPKGWDGKTWVKDWSILMRKHTADLRDRVEEIKKSVFKQYVDPFYCRKNIAPPIYGREGEKCYEKTPSELVKIREVNADRCTASENCKFKDMVISGTNGERIFELARDVLKTVDPTNLVNFAKAKQVYTVTEGVVEKLGGVDKLKKWSDEVSDTDKIDYLKQKQKILIDIIAGLTEPQYSELYKKELKKLQERLRDEEERSNITRAALVLSQKRAKEKATENAVAIEERTVNLNKIKSGGKDSPVLELVSDLLEKVDPKKEESYNSFLDVYKIVEKVVKPTEDKLLQLKKWSNRTFADKRIYLQKQTEDMREIIGQLANSKYEVYQKHYQNKLSDLEKEKGGVDIEFEKEERAKVEKSAIEEASSVAAKHEERNKAYAAALEAEAKEIEKRIEKEKREKLEALEEAMHLMELNGITSISKERIKNIKLKYANHAILAYFNAKASGSDDVVAKNIAIEKMSENMRLLRTNDKPLNEKNIRDAVGILQENINLYENHYPERPLLDRALETLRAETRALDMGDMSEVASLIKRKKEAEPKHNPDREKTKNKIRNAAVTHALNLRAAKQAQTSKERTKLHSEFIEALNLTAIKDDKEKSLITNDLLLGFFAAQAKIEKDFKNESDTRQKELHKLSSNVSMDIINMLTQYSDKITNPQDVEKAATKAMKSFFNLVNHYKSSTLWGGIDTALEPLRDKQKKDFENASHLKKLRAKFAHEKALRESWNLKEDILQEMYSTMDRFEKRSDNIKNINTFILDYWDSTKNKDEKIKAEALKKLEKAVTKEMGKRRANPHEIATTMQSFKKYVDNDHYRNAYRENMNEQDRKKFTEDDDPFRQKLGMATKGLILTGRAIAKIVENAETIKKLLPIP
ncbi:MAG: hypothetical protein HQK51_08380 [Oligoflexia bacterium]|nr:hypothetical protein [Oligoflexia bacterium]